MEKTLVEDVEMPKDIIEGVLDGDDEDGFMGPIFFFFFFFTSVEMPSNCMV